MDAPLPHPLAYLRQQYGWSMEDLARRLRNAARRRGLRSGYNRNRIWKWEHHRAEPSEESQELLAEVLSVPMEAVRAAGWPGWLPAFDQPRPLGPHDSRAVLMEIPMARLDRRGFLTLSTTALTGLAAQWAQVEPGRLEGALAGQHLDPVLLEWLEQRADDLRSCTALTAGPHQHTRDLVDTHLATTLDLIRTARYTPQAERRLYAVAATLTHTAAWARFDAGLHGPAQRHWHACVHAAHRVGDRDLAAVALSDLAYQATWMRRPQDAVAILDHARTRARTGQVRALLDVRRARALAVLQDRAGVLHALGQAETELTRGGTPPPPVVGWMSLADLHADAGRCWLDLDDPRHAQAAITAGLAELQPHRARTRTVFLVYRAEAALRQGEIPAATADAHAAIDTAADTRASRCIQLVTDFLTTASRTRAAPALGELRDHAHQRLPLA